MASYTCLHNELSDKGDGDNITEYKDPTQYNGKRLDQRKWVHILSMLIVIQILIILFVGFSGIFLYQEGISIKGPKPPYSPLYRDGAVTFINKNMKPETIFQQETSPEVEDAWNKPLVDHDKLVLLPSSLAAEGDLPESVELHLDPGYGAYAVSVYHQLHCLNRIRKTFYAEKFFANETQQEINKHKNHCFDLLRQALLCHGDPSLVYWWNDNYTRIDETGPRHYTDEYLSRSIKDRVKGSYLKWNVPTRCRDMHKIDSWIEKYAINVTKYENDSE